MRRSPPPVPALPPEDSSTLASLTLLLQAWQQGDQAAFGRIVGAVHGELMRMAASRLDRKSVV